MRNLFLVILLGPRINPTPLPITPASCHVCKIVMKEIHQSLTTQNKVLLEAQITTSIKSVCAKLSDVYSYEVISKTVC